MGLAFASYSSSLAATMALQLKSNNALMKGMFRNEGITAGGGAHILRAIMSKMRIAPSPENSKHHH